MTAYEAALDRFYGLMERLRQLPGRGGTLSELPRRSAVPARGVYFFFEAGEQRTASRVPRVVRVGTHAVSLGSRSTLHGRLRQHLGGRSGTGNHRGSIFRRHVGTALLAKEGKSVATWAVGTSPPEVLKASPAMREAERAWEARVSTFIGAMPVCWISVPDDPCAESDRARIERNAIALLSNCLAPIDAPSRGWLGRFSSEARIRSSGLWNLKHVEERYDPSFLDTFEGYVNAEVL